MAYWNKYGPVSMEQRAGECGPNFRNNNLAWFWYSSTLRPDCNRKFITYYIGIIESLSWESRTCSSSCMVPTNGRPSTTRAIIVIKAIVAIWIRCLRQDLDSSFTTHTSMYVRFVIFSMNALSQNANFSLLISLSGYFYFYSLHDINSHILALSVDTFSLRFWSPDWFWQFWRMMIVEYWEKYLKKWTCKLYYMYIYLSIIIIVHIYMYLWPNQHVT